MAGQLRHGIWILLGQLVLLIIAVVVALLLAEVWLFGAITLLEAFPQRPVLASGILLSLFAILFLCIRGAKMDSRPIAYFASRAVLLIGSAIAGIASLEAIVYGLAALGTHALREACLYLAGGLLLVAVAAAGVRYSFNWRLAYWIIFSAALAAVVFSVFGGPLSRAYRRICRVIFLLGDIWRSLSCDRGGNQSCETVLVHCQ